MTMSSNRRKPLFDVHPLTGASIEVFYADGLATFGRHDAGWFWWYRRRGFAPTGPEHGPFATTYRAYRDALYPRPGGHQRTFLGLGLQSGCNKD
jgi:hypothetical protein